MENKTLKTRNSDGKDWFQPGRRIFKGIRSMNKDFDDEKDSFEILDPRWPKIRIYLWRLQDFSPILSEYRTRLKRWLIEEFMGNNSGFIR